MRDIFDGDIVNVRIGQEKPVTEKGRNVRAVHAGRFFVFRFSPVFPW
jgi:hypothetical protein